ncbi:hypothetical protein H0484_15040 [Pusillimonas sp. CC-YST705]|uniref:Helix-turn-helix domain-containing protein n=1 Tax=Mesopusillimonas faecipullorum TaxID=2755040 RepID=A0ABS8CG78_9BURK|nr:hypothetical protein [Mesopusillimonas faecipullorum]
MSLIDEAIRAGARQSRACAMLGLSCRTLRRWRSAQTLVDQRKGASPFPHGTGSLSVDHEYLALEDGPPIFRQDFTCPALLI